MVVGWGEELGGGEVTHPGKVALAQRKKSILKKKRCASSLPRSPTAAALGGTGPAPQPGSPIELTLSAGDTGKLVGEGWLEQESWPSLIYRG